MKILPTPQQTVIFILTLIQCVLAFKYHIPMKLGLFYLAFSIDTWPYLFSVSPAFPYDLRRRSRRQTRVIACKRRRVRVHGRGTKGLFHNALVRLVNHNIEVISLLLKCSQCAFHADQQSKCQKERKNTTGSGTSGHVA